MKNFLIFIFLFISRYSIAQENTSYIMTGDVNLQECDVDGNKGSLPIRFVPNEAKFTIIKTTDDNYVIRFWKWQPDEAALVEYTAAAPLAGTSTYQKKANLEKVSTYYKELNMDVTGTAKLVRYFLIAKGNLQSYAAPLVSTTSPIYGAVVMPFKARPQNGFDFTKDLSISGMGGLRFSDPLGKKSVSVLLGVGIASVTLNESNTKNTITSNEERAAITVPIGVVAQWNKLQLGLFTGFDFLSQNNKSNWVYQNKPWLSLGIGFALFSEQEAPKKEGNN